jgi:hypothetical protein
MSVKDSPKKVSPTAVDKHAPFVVAYQVGRLAAAELTNRNTPKSSNRLRFELQAGTDAAAYLIEELLGLVISKVRSEAILRRDLQWYYRHELDLRADAVEWLLMKLEKYKVGEGHVSAYIATQCSWVASDLLFAYSTDAGKLDYSWYRIRAAANAVTSQLVETLGRNPTREELVQALILDASSEVSARYIERDPSLINNKVELDRKVHDRLSRDGVLAAIRNLDAIRELGSSDIRFDELVGDDLGAATIGSITPSSFDLEEHVLNSSSLSDPLEDLYSVALGDNHWARASLAGRFGVLDDIEGDASLPGVRRGGDSADRRLLTIPRLSELTGRDKVELRDTLSNAIIRLSAPHAQYAHLGIISVTSEKNNKTNGIYSRNDFIQV